MSEQNKNVSRRLLEEVASTGDYGLLDELVSGDFIGHTFYEGAETQGVEGYRQYLVMLRSAFPDLEMKVVDQVAEGDKVATRWTASGTHNGEFEGIPPTGRQGMITGMFMDRIKDGKVVECWSNQDDLGILQQIGAIPASV